MIVRRTTLAVISALVTTTLFSGLAGPAQAAKPIKIFEHRFGFVCDEPPLTNDTGTVIVAANTSSVEDPSAIVLYWVAPNSPETGEATFRSTADVPQVTVTGNHLDAVIPMEDQNFTPIGNAVISADLVSNGEPELGVGKSKEGNRTIKDNTVNQPLVVESGTLTLPDGTVFDLTGCPGADLTIDITITNPNQFVISHSGVLVLCDIASEDYVLNLGASAEDQGAAGAEVFFSDGEQSLGGFAEELTLNEEIFTATFPIIDFETEEFLGNAVLDATFTQGDHIALKSTEGSIHSKMIGYLLDVMGTITIPTDPQTIVDLSTCFAFAGTEQIKEHAPDAEE